MLPQPDFPKPLAPAGQGLRILLLEDDAIGVEIVGAYVERIEFARTHFHHAGTLAEALALLARVDVDLVISDLHLPDSSGAATVDALVRVVGCPVIAITSALSTTSCRHFRPTQLPEKRESATPNNPISMRSDTFAGWSIGIMKSTIVYSAL
jgi:CheY-like chemotaxis protein